MAKSSCPRAVGNVRQGSTKRIASVVGEGSVVVERLHRLFESDAAGTQVPG
jgi:hypothetical protein